MMNLSNTPSEKFAAFIGIDWADKKHDVWLQPAAGGRPHHYQVAQDPVALQAWLGELRQSFSGRPVALAVELSRGPLLAALLGVEFLVIFPINPKSLARYREAVRPSGAKDDRSDAQLLCEWLRHHYEQLKPWRPEDCLTRQLAGLTQLRRHWVNEVTAAGLRLRANLKNYYPVVLQLFSERLTEPMVLAFLERWPNLELLKKAKESQLRKFFSAHHSRSAEHLQKRLQWIAQAQALTQDEAVVLVHQADTEVLAGTIQLWLKKIDQLEKQIEALFAQHPDAYIFQSLPGAGRALGPRLLAALGTQRDRFPKALGIAQLSGIAPITLQSGEDKVVFFRYAKPPFLHQTFWEFAKCSIPHCAWARAFVDKKMNEDGMGYNAAVRALAFKWIRILWRLWQNRECYSEAKYTAALARHGAITRQQTPPQSAFDSAQL